MLAKDSTGCSRAFICKRDYKSGLIWKPTYFFNYTYDLPILLIRDGFVSMQQLHTQKNSCRNFSCPEAFVCKNKPFTCISTENDLFKTKKVISKSTSLHRNVRIYCVRVPCIVVRYRKMNPSFEPNTWKKSHKQKQMNTTGWCPARCRSYDSKTNKIFRN